jgi:signal transduction histidine kinase
LRHNQRALEEQVALRTVELTEANTAMRQQFEELALTKEELEKRNQVLQVVNDLTHHALSTFDLQVIFGRVIETTGRLIDATSAYVSVIDENGNGGTATVAAEYYGPEASQIERTSQLGASHSLQSRLGAGLGPEDQVQPYVIHIDDLEAPADLLAHMRQYGCQSILSVPILVKGQPVVLLEFWDSRRKRAFSEDEIELVEAIALQLAIPIENARLYAQARREIAERRLLEQQIAESLDRRSRQLRLTTQVAKDIIAATDLLDLYERVVAQVKEQFGFYHVQLLRYDPEGEALILIAGNEPIGERMVAEGHRLPLGSGLIGAAAALAQPVLRPVVAGDPQWQPNPLLPETRGELAVPIKLGEELLGILDIQSSVAGALDEDDQLVMEGLAGQIAIAIESTRLRQEMVDRLHELNELQRIMSREGWDAYRAQKADQVRGYRYLEASVKPLAERDEMAAAEGGSDYVRPDGAVVSTPMTIRGELIGSLGVEDDPEQPLTAEDRELLESISIQVAEALESARLLGQIQKHAIELEAVAQVSTAASTILEAQALLNTVARLTADRFALSLVAVHLLEDDDLHRAAGSLPEAEAGAESQLRLNDRYAPVARAARSRQPVLVQDSATIGKRVTQTLAAGTRSALAIPLIVGDQLLGVLDLQSDTPNRFSEDDVRIHTTLAAQVAVALQNAQLYARQLETAKRLQEVDQLKSEFLASMSHELRTPLNSIIGFADVLLEGIDGELNDRMREDVGLIRESGRHLRMLIGEMLDMSKIEAGLMELHYEPIDVPALAREIIASTRSLAGEKDLAIDLELDPDLEMVEADRTRLTQVLLNLLGNAVKFTKQGSVTLTIQQQNGDLLVSVRDTGIGIRQEDIPLIFEQFRQIDGSLTREAGGTGLGIPISRSLVELHGGQMWVESKPNVGSTFSFTIPRQRPEGVPPTVTTARSRLTGQQKGQPGRQRPTSRPS